MESYEDRPYDIEKWLETLTDKERELFDRGYITALNGVLEHMVEIKNTLLSKSLDLEDNLHLKRQLLSRVHILDVMEKHYRKRVKVLEPQYDG